ncbi:ATP-dependent Clp protease adaptor ClpS [Moraxella pluranimalium]|nr:ATP-dependent Clp protease adaptor ClpS [Moraxella pluranimalium]
MNKIFASGDEHSQSDISVGVITQTKPMTARPQMYAVVMHNDNYTTMEFVVFVLVEIFEHDMDEAYRLMMQIHETGRAVVAILPFDIAEMKVDEVNELAEQEEYPLLTTIEKL